jgi:hypothetical protein
MAEGVAKTAGNSQPTRAFPPISVTEMLGKTGKIMLRHRIDARPDICFFPGQGDTNHG